MSSSFKPLGAGPGPQANTQSAADLKAAFKPMALSGNHTPTTLAPQGYPVHTPHTPPPVAHHPAPEEPSPRVFSAITRLIRDGERITHIEIQCGCGEVITLECGYAAG